MSYRLCTVFYADVYFEAIMTLIQVMDYVEYDEFMETAIKTIGKRA
ncbi:MAG: hypothetical protein QW331_04360 [Candidatus Woesearchaeota archaeon]